jgi:hypothetical protein
MENGEQDDDADDDVAPGTPIPAEQLGRYSPVRDPHAEKDVADYVHSQARDEAVTHVEKVKSEYVMGDEYEVWDVTTDVGRWWVIGNPMNLYSRQHFESLDYTLSFHVGLMMRLRTRRERNRDSDPTPLDKVFRRFSQASTRLESAVEAEDYQAVGMLLRESLLSLVSAIRRRVEVQQEGDRPKEGDFINWSALLLDSLCGGASNKALRQYLKSHAERTWQLVSALTHDRDAAETAAEIALRACDSLTANFLRMLVRREADETQSCPRCASRDIRNYFDIAIPPDGRYYNACGSCGWDDHPENR